MSSLPDGMDAFTQLHCCSAIDHKFLHQLKLVYRTCFKTTGVVKYEAWIGPKDQLVFDVVVSPLTVISASNEN